MTETWSGEEPTITPEKLHMMLAQDGVTHLKVEYTGSGDAADYFDVILTRHVSKEEWSVVRDDVRAMQDSLSKLNQTYDYTERQKAKAEHKARFSGLEKYENSKENEDGSGATQVSRLDKLFPERANDIIDTLSALITENGGAWDFNDDGCSGDLDWDITTNKCTLASGMYITERHDDGFCADNLFDANLYPEK